MNESLLDDVEIDEVEDENNSDEDVKIVKICFKVIFYKCENILSNISRVLDKICKFKFAIWSNITYNFFRTCNNVVNVCFEFKKGDAFIEVVISVLMNIIGLCRMNKIKMEIQNREGFFALSSLFKYDEKGIFVVYLNNFVKLLNKYFNNKYSENEILKYVSVCAIKNNILKGRNGYYSVLESDTNDHYYYIVVDSNGNVVIPRTEASLLDCYYIRYVYGNLIVVADGKHDDIYNVFDIKKKTFLFESNIVYCRVCEDASAIVYKKFEETTYSIYSIDKCKNLIEGILEFTYSDGLFGIKEDRDSKNCWNFMNSSGQMISDRWFSLCRSFSEGCAVVELDDGKRTYETYVDNSGKFIMKKRFKKCGDFHDGLAFVIEENGYLYDYRLINKKGEFVTDLIYEEYLNFDEGFARVKLDGANGYTFIDKTGLPITDKTFEETSFFADGFAAVLDSDGWTYIDTNGNFINDERYEDFSDFYDGRAVVETYSEVKIGNKYKKIFVKKVIDKEGKVIVSSSDIGYTIERVFGKFLLVSSLKSFGKFLKTSSLKDYDSSPDALNTKYNYYIVGKGLLLDEWIPQEIYERYYEYVSNSIDSYHVVLDANGKCNVVGEDGSVMFNEWIDSNIVLKPGGVTKIENDVYADCKSGDVVSFI